MANKNLPKMEKPPPPPPILTREEFEARLRQRIMMTKSCLLLAEKNLNIFFKNH